MGFVYFQWNETVTCGRYGGKESAYRVLVGKPDGKRTLGRPRCRWEDDIKMDLQNVGWGEMYWIALAQDSGRWRDLVNAVMNMRISYAGNFCTI
jgi:hypothetical protein